MKQKQFQSSRIFRYCLSFTAFLLHFHLSFAQVPTLNDSVADTNTYPKNDTAVLDLFDKKKNNKFNRLLRKVFVKQEKKKDSIPGFDTITPISFKQFQGKIIRNIYIESNDPFGHSITDSTKKPEKLIERIGNFLHHKTRKFVIRDYLLFRKGQKFDSIKILESERLIRNQYIIRSIVIDPTIIGESDSVDLYVRTLDSWSILPQINYSSNNVSFRLRERNFLGFGHEFDNRYRKNFETGKFRIQSRYTIPNIFRSYVGLSVGYSENEYGEQSKGVSLYRTFFSPLTRWAGGVHLGETSYQDSIPNNYAIPNQRFRYNIQDYWMGVSFLLGNISNHSKDLNNLVFAARYFRVNYISRPARILDPNQFYSDENFFLFSVGVSQRSYVQDQYIRNFEIIEDIPVGKSFTLIGGVQNKNEKNRFYYASKLKFGNYHPFGYLSFNLEYGGFLRQFKTDQSTFAIKAQYFSHLKSIKRWNYRFFITSKVIVGNNRFDSRGDRLTLNENDSHGISGFYSRDLIGNKKWISYLTMQTYSPYKLLGFRFSPFIQGTFGMISNHSNLLSEKLYTKIGAGITFTNDYLIFSNFKLSLAWYNSIPGQGESIFKTNTVEHQNDFEMMDYSIGKPRLVEYNPYIIN